MTDFPFGDHQNRLPLTVIRLGSLLRANFLEQTSLAHMWYVSGTHVISYAILHFQTSEMLEVLCHKPPEQYFLQHYTLSMLVRNTRVHRGVRSKLEPGRRAQPCCGVIQTVCWAPLCRELSLTLHLDLFKEQKAEFRSTITQVDLRVGWRARLVNNMAMHRVGRSRFSS